MTSTHEVPTVRRKPDPEKCPVCEVIYMQACEHRNVYTDPRSILRHRQVTVHPRRKAGVTAGDLRLDTREKIIASFDTPLYTIDEHWHCLGILDTQLPTGAPAWRKVWGPSEDLEAARLELERLDAALPVVPFPAGLRYAYTLPAEGRPSVGEDTYAPIEGDNKVSTAEPDADLAAFYETGLDHRNETRAAVAAADEWDIPGLAGAEAGA